jgi:Antibiotic biosynthesis monooxygenase
MAGEVSWVFKVAVYDGAMEEFRALVAEMNEKNEAAEPDPLVYEWFLADDESTVHLYERYADNAPAMNHVVRFGENFAGRFLALLTVTGVDVYGPAGDDLKEAIAGFTPTYYATIGGFAR